MYKFPIIVFEGIEASGKSYHIKNIKNYLTKNKIKFISFREPGGSESAEKIRRLILNKKSKFNNLTDLLLYMAARNENFHNILSKNHKKKVILIDRFTDSTMAYQHYGMNINKKLIIKLNKIILKNIKPTFTFLNTVNMKNLQSRINKRTKNRYDKFSQSFYTKAQRSFLQLARNKKNYFILNSSSNNSDLEKKIFKIVCKYLKIK